jgi:hypothetical protein
MRFKAASIYVTDDNGNRVGGPYALPLDREAKREINRLMREFGPIKREPISEVNRQRVIH